MIASAPEDVAQALFEERKPLPVPPVSPLLFESTKLQS
jgi:hypothetical protein